MLRPAGLVVLNIIGALVIVVPVVVGAAVLESTPRAATPGKRALGLQVSAGGGTPSFRTALLRNALKIGLPWLVGHAAVFALISAGSTVGPASAGADLALVLAYVLPVVYVVCLFLGTGRTPYDRVARTRVVLSIQARASRMRSPEPISPPR